MSGELFTRGFPASSGPCTCSSACCEGGVFLDLRERDVIMAHKTLIAGHMDEKQDADPANWFETEEHDDEDFPSGRCVGTRVLNDKCAFLDRSGHCTLQVSATDSGLHKWALKPLFCILYPIEIGNGVVSFDDMLQEEESCCTVSSRFDIPLFEGCREELVHIVGDDGFAAMEAHYAGLQKTGTGI